MANDSCDNDEETRPLDLFSFVGGIVCPVCGRGVDRSEGSVVACAECDYCSLDSDFVKNRCDEDQSKSLVRLDPDDENLTTERTEKQSETHSKCLKCDKRHDSLSENIPDDDFGTIMHFCQNCNEFSFRWLLKCEDCGNCCPEWFEELYSEAEKQLLCLICLRVLKIKQQFQLEKLVVRIKDAKARKKSQLLAEEPKHIHKRVENLKQLRYGDHIAWDREYLVWHHAIVTAVDSAAGQITVIHNSGGIKDLPNGHIASVRVENFQVDCDVEFLYMFEYSESECFAPDEVIERATQRLDEVYDPLTNNCEHFARWCKTGVKYSIQRKDFDDRLKMGASGFAKVIEEFLTTAVRFFGNSESIQDILGISTKDAIVDARLGVFTLTESTNVVRGLQLGAILMGIVLAIFAEIVFFCCKLYEAKKDADAKYMPTDVFQRCVFQLMSEGLVGLGGGLGAAFGMSLVPYAGPFLSPVGYVLGNWVGRFLGALIGRLTMRGLHRNKIFL